MSRTAVSFVCLLLACLLVPTAIAAGWVRTTVSDTDRYVATVGPLADDPDVQAAVVDLLTRTVMEAVEERALLEKAVARLAEHRGVPRRVAELMLRGLGPAREQLELRVHAIASEVVSGESFSTAWRDSNASAHRHLINALESDGGGQAVQLDLATAANTLREELRRREVPFAERIPEVQASFSLAEPEQIERARKGYQLLHVWADRLVSAAAIMAFLGLLLARRRGRALAWWLAGSGLACLAVLALLPVGRDHLLGGVDLDEALTRPVFDILTDRLRLLLWLATGLTAAALTLLAALAPVRRALRIRGGSAPRARP